MKRHPLVFPILALLPAFLLTWRAGATMLTPLLAVVVLLLLWHLKKRKNYVPVDTDKIADKMLSDPFAMMTQMRTGQSVSHLPSRRGKLSLWSAVWGGYVACILMAELATGYEGRMDVTVYLPYLVLPLILMAWDPQSTIMVKSSLRFSYPLWALLGSSLLLFHRTNLFLSAPFIGLAAFYIIQRLYNTTERPQYPDGSKTLEQMTAAQMNDPALAGAAARGGDRGGAFLPTRDIRATDLQRTTIGSWLIVCLTLLGTIAQADELLHTGPATFIPYRLPLLWVVLLFILERVALWREQR